MTVTHQKFKMTMCHRKFEMIVCHRKFEMTACHREFEMTVCHQKFEMTVCHRKFEMTVCHREFVNDRVPQRIWDDHFNFSGKLSHFENENTFRKRTTFWKRKLIPKCILKMKTFFLEKWKVIIPFFTICICFVSSLGSCDTSYDCYDVKLDSTKRKKFWNNINLQWTTIRFCDFIFIEWIPCWPVRSGNTILLDMNTYTYSPHKNRFA